MRVAFQTLGCKLNFAETSTIGRQFLHRNFEVVEPDQTCDVYVLNTCSVTDRAERECRQLIRRILRHSPHAFVIVVGCYAQLKPNEIASIEGVDLILGSQEKFNLLRYLNNLNKRAIPQIYVSCIDEAVDFIPAYSADVGGRTRAFLKIQDGCDYKCAFCTIPLARGESRSLPIKNILNQAHQIAELGYKEIVLTGVNVGDYGRKIGSNLFYLMLALENVNGIERIRISSIEPNLLSDEIIDFILESEKYCNHFHIPLQSGSDVILKKMQRRYRTEEYLKSIEYIKSKDTDTGIGVDVIVGYPGESDELFESTYQFLKQMPISYLHVFTYSERQKTSAENLPEKIEPRIRHERNIILQKLSQEKRAAFYSSFIGRKLSVLFEGNMHDDCISGLGKNYIRVSAIGDHSLVNTIQDVTINNIKKDVCIGVLSTKSNLKIPINKFEETVVTL
ncbi:MAG: tRNA (N(6)-L-threonylcarbamoyladenosine(37)-C(2))-methylthiotransferase MtaB [Bacteroidota bacterium]|nr:tRNA (N(6)-L-threonylcarbamoyladenosine(37)-C(2))-methylthiotransferase MtaB [Bacteroidota bacterium]